MIRARPTVAAEEVDGRQVAAARTLLGWSQEHLAELAGITRKTLGNLEAGRDISSPKLRQVMDALENAGVQFVTAGNQVGVLLKR